VDSEGGGNEGAAGLGGPRGGLLLSELPVEDPIIMRHLLYEESTHQLGK